MSRTYMAITQSNRRLVGLEVSPTHCAKKKRPPYPSFTTHISQQDAQVPLLLPETQDATQTTTQTEASPHQHSSPTYNGNELVRPRDTHYNGPNPKKKQKLTIDTESTRVKKVIRPEAPKNMSSIPRRIVTLRYAPKSDSVATTSAKTSLNGRAPNVAARTRAPLVQENPQAPDHKSNEYTQTAQSQTTQFLRRSARNLGLGVSSDTQHVELVHDGLSRPQHMPKKRIKNEPTSPVKAESRTKPSLLNARPNAPKLETRKRRKPPQIEAVGWI
jgi:hypothetical protein